MAHRRLANPIPPRANRVIIQTISYFLLFPSLYRPQPPPDQTIRCYHRGGMIDVSLPTVIENRSPFQEAPRFRERTRVAFVKRAAGIRDALDEAVA